MADKGTMRTLFLLVAIGAAACTKHNPDSCCTSQQQCNALGIGGVTACNPGRTCDPTGTCVEAQCTTSGDCTSAGSPICEDQLCVAKCTTDVQCPSSRPYCGTGGECDACTMDSQCTTAAPICDSAIHTCRGCAEDAECPSGVCLDNERVCAESAAIVWVAQAGVDTGTCTHDARCRTLPYAVGNMSQARDVLRIDGTTVDAGAATIMFVAKRVYIDAGTSSLSRTGVVFDVGNGATLSLSGFLTIPDGPAPAIKVETGGVLNVARVKFGTTTADPFAAITLTGGVASIDRATFSGQSGFYSGVACSGGGVVSINSSTFNQLDVSTSSCELHLTRNTFQSQRQSLYAQGGTVTIENNVFTTTYEFQDSASVSSTAPGSYVRFNTWVDTSSSTLGGVGLNCSGNLEVSNNIFVFGPQGTFGCTTTYSLFDIAQMSTTGTNNTVANKATFFVDMNNSDFHLVAGSPAKAAADPAAITATDHDGNARPNPAGTAPDIGAYEAQ
jgi:hypothetical protein